MIRVLQTRALPLGYVAVFSHSNYFIKYPSSRQEIFLKIFLFFVATICSKYHTYIYTSQQRKFNVGEYMKQNLQQIKKAKLGDAAAFAELYRDIYADLYRFALYTLKNPTDAEDAVSETVTDAFTSIRNLRQEESFSSWIFKILSVKCKKRFQEIATLPEELLRDIPDEGSMGNIAVYMDLRRQFFRLSDEERLIISMHIFAGYSSTEIAEILHMNANTVRSKESRALKKLSDQLEAPVRQ